MGKGEQALGRRRKKQKKNLLKSFCLSFHSGDVGANIIPNAMGDCLCAEGRRKEDEKMRKERKLEIC